MSCLRAVTQKAAAAKQTEQQDSQIQQMQATIAAYAVGEYLVALVPLLFQADEPKLNEPARPNALPADSFVSLVFQADEPRLNAPKPPPLPNALPADPKADALDPQEKSVTPNTPPPPPPPPPPPHNP